MNSAAVGVCVCINNCHLTQPFVDLISLCVMFKALLYQSRSTKLILILGADLSTKTIVGIKQRQTMSSRCAHGSSIPSNTGHPMNERQCPAPSCGEQSRLLERSSASSLLEGGVLVKFQAVILMINTPHLRKINCNNDYAECSEAAEL